MQKPSPSVLAGMPTFEWDSREAVAYEVAIEAITQAVAWYTDLIERARERGDTPALDELTAAQAACIAEREQLRSTDHAAVARVRQEYPELVRQLQAQAR